MNKLRLALLSGVAVVSLGGGACAGDMGPGSPFYKAEPIPYAPWQGAFVGANIGVARMNSNCGPGAGSYELGEYNCMYSDEYGSSQAISDDTSVLFGAQAGYDWQDRNFVYGVVGDWSWTNLNHTVYGYSGSYSYHAQIDWLASFRGRMGLAVDNTMVYATGGVALGAMNARSTGDNGYYSYGVLNAAKVGWVAGLGVEHQFDPHWSFFAEALYYGFPTQTVSGGYDGYNYINEYNFEVFTARVGVNYKLPF